VSSLLRVAAFYSFAWAVGLACPGLLPADPASEAALRSLELALMGANLAFAYLFWIAAAAPASARPTLYAALLVFGLRAAIGTYEVLYVLEGAAAVIRLVDMVLSLALFVGILNALPGALGVRGTPRS
jgi:heme A synthase